MFRRFPILALALAPALSADVRVIEQIVCKVNGDIITMGDLERRQNLREQIDELLLTQKARDLNLSVESDLARRIAELQVRSGIVDPDRFHQWVREQFAMSYEDFCRQLRNQLLMERVIGEEIRRSIVIPDAAGRKYYEEHRSEFVREDEVWLQKIFLSTEGRRAEQIAAAEAKAKQLVERARRGEKFGELARDNSNDPETARNSGEMPPFQRGQLRREIDDTVFQAKKGYVTDPLRIPEGFLILRVVERYAKGPATYDEVEQEIAERLARPLLEPKLRAYLTRLRQDAFLQIRDGYVDAGAAPEKDTRWQAVAELKPETTTKEEVAASRRKRLLGIIPLR